MDSSRLSMVAIMFWIIFPFPLIALGYTVIPITGPASLFSPFINGDIIPSHNDVVSALPNAPGSNVLVFFADLVFGLFKIIIFLINFVVLIFKFGFIFITTLTLTFGDVNFYLARILNLFQIISLIAFAHYARGTK